MKLGGCLAHLRPWSADELTLLREHYVSDGAAFVAEKTGRSLRSVFLRANRLGISYGRAWSAKADAKLTMLWGDVSVPALAATFNRSQNAVVVRARGLGLPVGAPDGWEYLTASQARTGFSISTIRKIAKWAQAEGVVSDRWPPIRVALHAPHGKRKWRRHIVEIEVLDEAIAAWMDAETMEAASRRYGVSAEAVRRALMIAGLVPPEGLRGRHWRVATKTIDAAMAKRAERESVLAAARRLGVSRYIIARRLEAAGFQRNGYHWEVRREDIDRAVAA